MRGQATDIKIHADWILKTKERINRILAERTGQPLEKIERDTDRDFFMNAEEAKEYGLMDQVMTRITRALRGVKSCLNSMKRKDN